MSISPKDRYWHRVYEALPSRCVWAIDEAFQAMRAALKEDETLTTAGDDRAESLVAAITCYLCESNPDNQDFQRAIEEVNEVKS